MTASMLDVVTDGLAIGAEVDHHVVVENAIIDRLARPQLDVKAVRGRIVIEIDAYSEKSLSLKTL